MKRIPALVSLVSVLSIASAPAADTTARSAMNRGLAAYSTGDYPVAAGAFAEAARLAPEQKLDPATAAFNTGNALLKQGQWQEAAQAYSNAYQTRDIDLIRKAYYNCGTALFEGSTAVASNGDAQAALPVAQEALKTLAQSIWLDPSNTDAKVNYELAGRWVEELKQMAQQQQQQQQNQQKSSDDKKSDKDNSQKQDQPPSPDNKNGEDQQPRQKEEEKDSKESASQQAGQDQEPSREEGQAMEAKDAQEMSKDEAVMILDALRQREQALRENMQLRRGRIAPAEKDW